MEKKGLAWFRKAALSTTAMVGGWKLASKYTDNIMLELMAGTLASGLTNWFNEEVDKQLIENSKVKETGESPWDSSPPNHCVNHAERIRSEQESYSKSPQL